MIPFLIVGVILMSVYIASNAKIETNHKVGFFAAVLIVLLLCWLLI